MSENVISDDDEIARCIIFPKAFQGAIHTDEMLFSFGETKADGASHESGVLCRLTAGSEGIHSIGCGIAAFQNEQRNFEPASAKRRFYCGFRKAIARDVSISGDGYKVTLTLDGEGGQEAHIDIALFVEGETKNERNLYKVEAGMALAEVFGPVDPHMCATDADNDRHPLVVDPDCLTRGMPRLSSMQTNLALD